MNVEELKDDSHCSVPLIRNLLSLTTKKIQELMSVNNTAKNKNRSKAALLWALLWEWLEEGAAMANQADFNITECELFYKYNKIRGEFNIVIDKINLLRTVSLEGKNTDKYHTLL